MTGNGEGESRRTALPLTQEDLITEVTHGFVGGFAALGVNHISPRPAAFESCFSRAWANWPPAARTPLSYLTAGRYGSKVILYRLRAEAFKDTFSFSGVGLEHLLGIWAPHATPEEWRELARAYLSYVGPQDSAQGLDSVPAQQHDSGEWRTPAVQVPPIGRNGIRVPGGLVRRRTAPLVWAHGPQGASPKQAPTFSDDKV